MRMLAFLRMLDRLVVRLALGIAMTLLALMSCITFWQVLTRFILEEPSTWSEVTARSLMIWMVYLGLCVVLRSGSLIAVDVLMSALPEGFRKALAVLIALISLAVLIVLVWFGWAMTERASMQSIAGLRNPFTGSTVSIAFVYAAIPVGAALSIIAVIAKLVDDLTGKPNVQLGPATRDV